MHRRRPAIVWLCLLALVWCQVAMSSQFCHAGANTASAAGPVDCHEADADNAATGDAPHCPGDEVTPDLGKLPTVAPLLTGHDFAAAASTLARVVDGATERSARARDGPELDALCRLLI